MNNKSIITFNIIGLILLPLLNVFLLPVFAENIIDDQDSRDIGLIELQVDHIKQSVAPNLSGTKASAEYVITIWNWDSTWDMYDITEINNHGFEVSIDPTITSKVDPDDFTQVIVEIIIDNKAHMTVDNYDTTVTATSRKNESISESITLKTQILQAYGVELQPWDGRLETDDTFTGNHRTVEFQLQLENLGTGEDTFKLEFHGDYSDWATLNDTSYLKLLSKQKKSMTITVKVPRETRIGDIEIYFMAISRGDDTIYQENSDATDEVTLTVEVTQFYELTLSTSETPKTGKPGETIDFKFKVINYGNGEDIVELRKSDFNVNWDWTLSSPKFQLQPINDPSGSDIREITLTVDIPIDIHGKNGTYNISIYVYSEGTPKGDILQNDGIPLNFSVYVGPIYDLDLFLDYPTSTDDQRVDPGGEITYKFTLVNLGNSYDTVNLKAQGDKSKWVVFTNSELILEPFGNVKFDLTVKIPNLTDENILDIEAKKYELLINATSKNDPDAIAGIFIEPQINELLKTKMETDLPLDVSDTGYIITDPNKDPYYSSFSLTLENCGNSVDAITLSTSGASEWVLNYLYENYNSPTISVTINPGVSENIIVHVFAPDNAKDGEIKRFTIIARSKNDKVTSSVDIKGIVKTAVIKLKDIEISDNTAGSETTVKLIVINSGTADAKDVDINFYDNGVIIHSERISLIRANQSLEVLFNYELDDGDHELVAKTVWSDETVKDETTFTTENVGIGSTLILLILISVIVITILLVLAVLIRAKKRSMEVEPQIRRPDQERFKYPRNAVTRRDTDESNSHNPPEKLRPS
jgi:uncharacterized membrane protein